ncbi:hypothetical protein BJV82DRAFT_637650 [Fennellomyces sp. T-0311]|nr:hypothetical protein BJV82DRAFT_637650 [Fennellomyces sp. T-0311]
MPGFIASWPHFVLDWFVHRSDMYLNPCTKLVVGGAGLWDKTRTGAFVLETLLILGTGHLLAQRSLDARNKHCDAPFTSHFSLF